MSSVFDFPNPVNEKAARVVAAGVVLFSLLALLPGLTWLALPIACGFLLRVASGPRFSPLLESVFAICLGCVVFGWLMRVGVISEEVCEACNNVGLRYSENG